MARYRRCKTAWQQHLEQCHRHILHFTQSLPPHSHILILGAGALLDIPLSQIAPQHRITLVDIVRLPQARWKLRRHSQITWITSNVLHDPLPHADAVISLNLLSQLPIIPLKNTPSQNYTAAARSLIQQHLNQLEALAPQRLLISDTRWQCWYRGTLISDDDALHDVQPPGTKLNEWTWYIAPAPEAHTYYDTQHQVAAWRW